MAIVSKLLGNSVRTDPHKVEKSLKHILVADEHVELAFKVIRDETVFTNFRIIMVDKKGATGLKTIYHTIPYNSIVHFSVTSSGVIDIDSELKIWITGQKDPLEVGIRRSSKDFYDIQMELASHTLAMNTQLIEKPIHQFEA